MLAVQILVSHALKDNIFSKEDALTAAPSHWSTADALTSAPPDSSPAPPTHVSSVTTDAHHAARVPTTVPHVLVD